MPKGLSNKMNENCTGILLICAQHFQENKHRLFCFHPADHKRHSLLVGQVFCPQVLSTFLQPERVHPRTEVTLSSLPLYLAHRTLHLQVVQGDPTIVHTAPLSLVIP